MCARRHKAKAKGERRKITARKVRIRAGELRGLGAVACFVKFLQPTAHHTTVSTYTVNYVNGDGSKL